ncbi:MULTISPECIES: AraC family transcriptional regulator [unclassified Marinobacter]|uniref:helix-turn-helix transcriptional regulator n=1 Tax=unclassified Marinobacter TaxID=83889 RepID=UPI0026E2980E|nr:MULTISPECIES: AraC family transcriptional regulator [unclassified Marinobacter]MDO6440681.1 AraC family transcriptional regulator [Marinobacter sp. 2_MG-2023]MDO6823509.1 AraC family transcriptional regulator [Marinobacter sp. 1_MG-2023]
MLDARLLKLPTASHQHRHEHHQIVIGVRGEADLSVDGTGSHLDTWKACLVPTEARHDYCGDHQNHVMVINLDPSTPVITSPHHADYERMVRVFEKPRTIHMDSRLQGLVQFAAGEFDRSPGNLAMHGHLAASILYCMADRVVDRKVSVPSRHSLSPDAMQTYIRDNLHRKITVQELASEACLSVSRFHEVFRDVVGTTPHQFLLQARLNQAMNLLASTQLSVSEISYRVGFSSQSALTNALRKHKGTTPTRLQVRDNVA